MPILESIYDEDFDFDSVTIADMFGVALTLLDMEMPVPTDLIARLHRAGVYIAH